MSTTYVYHTGVKGKSGRYPWGSGDRPYQRLEEAHGGIFKKKWKAASKSTDTSKKASDMSIEELEDFRKRKRLENYYKQNKDPSKLETAADIARNSNEAFTRAKAQIDEMYREERKRDRDRMDLSNFSDEELRKAVSRLQLEAQYKSLSPSDVKKGEVIAKETLSTLGSIAAVTASTLGIVISVRKLMGKD